MIFGVVRPGWVVEGGERAHNADGHCFINAYGGYRWPGRINWEGRQDEEQGDSIGMLLDLDQGSMTAWKNDVRLGVMVAEGLSGPFTAGRSHCTATASSWRRRPRPRRKRSWRRRRHGRRHSCLDTDRAAPLPEH